MEQQKWSVLGLLLDKIVNDIFDSSTSESSFEEDSAADNTEFHTADDYKESPGSLDDKSSDEGKPTISRQQSRSSISVKELETKHCNVDMVVPIRSQDELKEYVKVSRSTFDFILDFIKHDLSRKFHGNGSIPPALQLLLTLRKMSSLDSYNEICKKFHIAKATAIRAVHRVIRAISNRSSKFIVWPTLKRMHYVCRGFQTLSGFPKIIGALDSLPVSIPNQRPDVREDPYTLDICHSVQLQVVVDHTGLFTFCSVGSFGCIEKQEVFNKSILRLYVSKPEERRFPQDSHLVANSDYDLHEHVMVPYINADLTTEQENFNQHLQEAHNCVTKTISALKSRFASLRFKLDMCRVDLVPIYLTACCVLHNISVYKNDLIDYPVEILTPELNDASSREITVASSQGLKKRDLLSNQLRLSKTEGVCLVTKQNDIFFKPKTD